MMRYLPLLGAMCSLLSGCAALPPTILGIPTGGGEGDQPVSHESLSSLVGRLPVVGALCVFLTACSTPPPETVSIADDVTESEAPVMSNAIMGFVKRTLPPAQSVVAFADDKPFGADPIFVPLHEQLTKAGYGVALRNQADPHAHNIRYRITPYLGGLILVVDIDSKTASQFFLHNTVGNLQAASALAVRN